MSNSTFSVTQAIETLMVLKQAQPELFFKALEQIQNTPINQEIRSQSASKLVETILHGQCTEQNQALFLNLIEQMPKLEDNSLALGIPPSTSGGSVSFESLLARCVYLHGICHQWTLFLIRSMRSGIINPDSVAAREILWRLESIRTDTDMAPSLGLEDPESFGAILHEFFELNLDWNELCSQVGLNPIAWIVEHWLESSIATQALALKTILNLVERNTWNLNNVLWIEFCSKIEHSENYSLALKILEYIMPKKESAKPGESLLCNFMKLVNPNKFTPLVVKFLIKKDPVSPFILEQGQFSVLYWINQRLSQPGSHSWQQPLLEVFDLICQSGVSPLYILPQYNPVGYASHVHIQASVSAYLEAQTLRAQIPSKENNEMALANQKAKSGLDRQL